MPISGYIKAIGEISIRVNNMDQMIAFYKDILGFKLRRRFNDDVAALKLADGVAGQIQTLTLFGKGLPGNFEKKKWEGLDNNKSPLHHFALTISNDDYLEVQACLIKENIQFDTANHRWCGWKGIYIQDPEKNIIELVCYDQSFDEGKTGGYNFDKLHGAKSGKAFT